MGTMICLLMAGVCSTYALFPKQETSIVCAGFGALGVVLTYGALA